MRSRRGGGTRWMLTSPSCRRCSLCAMPWTGSWTNSLCSAWRYSISSLYEVRIHLQICVYDNCGIFYSLCGYWCVFTHTLPYCILPLSFDILISSSYKDLSNILVKYFVIVLTVYFFSKRVQLCQYLKQGRPFCQMMISNILF